MKVGVIANPYKEGAAATIEVLQKELSERHIETQLEDVSAEIIGEVSPTNARQLAQECDVIAVLGGDGTMLNAAHRIGASETPLVGINVGTFGFLTSCTHKEVHLFADALVDQTYKVIPRILLDIKIVHADGKEERDFAVNEVTLSRGQTGRLISIDAFIDGEFLNHYHADGLIVATPTGSTAYSLSAGGPLISPSAQTFVITPICPHSLSNRSLVLADSSEIELSIADSSECQPFYSIDGRNMTELPCDSKIMVKKAQHTLHVLRLENRSFFSSLRQQLQWK